MIPDLRQVPAVSLASISNKNFFIKSKHFFLQLKLAQFEKQEKLHKIIKMLNALSIMNVMVVTMVVLFVNMMVTQV